MGRDCLDFRQPVDWVITNPPWSAVAYRRVASHCFEIAESVVFLVRLDVAVGTYARLADAARHGQGLRQLILCSWAQAGFAPRGTTLVVAQWERGWRGPTTWLDRIVTPGPLG